MNKIICQRCQNVLPSFEDLELHASSAHGLENFCAFCQETFNEKCLLRRHREKNHLDIKNSYLNPIKCCRCDHRFRIMIHFCKHLQNVHGFKGKIEQLTFNSQTKFNRWKMDVEQRGKFSFRKKTCGQRGRLKWTEFLCYRSGCFLCKKKIPESRSPYKSYFYCSAFATVKESKENGEISVEYCLDHYERHKILHIKNISPVTTANTNSYESNECVREELRGDPVQSTDQMTSAQPKHEITDESSIKIDDDQNDNLLLAVTRENISKQLSVFCRLVAQPAVCDHLVSKPVIARQVLQKLHEIVKLIASAQRIN